MIAKNDGHTSACLRSWPSTRSRGGIRRWSAAILKRTAVRCVRLSAEIRKTGCAEPWRDQRETGGDPLPVEERFGDYTRIEAVLETGRTHQIRVHMAYIRHPLVGDPLYGPKKQTLGVEGQLLHAGVLGFVHPSTGEYMEFSCPRPAYLKTF